ncbi:MAG: tellurite resistance TerB family protein [Alphaproteobacteria bacterium]
MADLQRILGTMLASGMGGRSHGGMNAMGSVLGNSGFGAGAPGGAFGAASGNRGMGVGSVAGLGALGYLAFKAFQERQRNQGVSGQGAQPAGGPGGSPWGDAGGILGSLFGGGAAGSTGRSESGQGGGQVSGQGGGSLSDRLSQVFQSRGTPQTEDRDDGAYPAVAMEDQQALLLIRAMIAAANADGEITPDERRHILDTLDEAGAGAEERRIVEQELDRPQPLDSLLQSVKDQQTAEQVYLASRMAVNEQSEAERSYLQYLASRLKLDPQRVQQMNQAA